MQRYKRCANIPMNTTIMVNVVTTQYRGCYSEFPMKLPLITNALTMQRRRYYINLLMNVFAIMNVFNTQQYWYCDIFSIKVL